MVGAASSGGAVGPHLALCGSLPQGPFPAIVAHMSDQSTQVSLAEAYLKFLLDNPGYRPLASSTKAYKALREVDMGPQPPTTRPGSFRLILRWKGPNSVIAENIMYGEAGTYSGTQTQVQTVATILGTQASGSSGIRNLVSPEWTLHAAICQDNSGTGNFYQNTVDLPGQDPGTGNSLPPNVAAVISWDVDKRYKGGHPRTYLPGIQETNLSTPGSNEWTSSFTSLLKSQSKVFLDALVTSLASQFAGALVGTLSTRANFAWKNPPDFWHFVDSKSHPRVDTQRRRLGKEITAG